MDSFEDRLLAPRLKLGRRLVAHIHNGNSDLQESGWGIERRTGSVQYIFPNTILFAGTLSPGKDYYTTVRHFPSERPGQTVTHMTTYAPKAVQSEEYRAEVEASYDVTAHMVESEDYVVAAEGWGNLASLPPGSSVVYGWQEQALQDVHHSISDAIGMPLPVFSPVLEAAEWIRP